MSVTFTSVRFKPLGQRILVLVDAAEEKTSSGLYLADVAQEKPQTGTVVAVGSAVKDCKEGYDIAFGKYSGSPITIDGDEYLILKEEEVFGIL